MSSWSGCGGGSRRAREQELTPRQREMVFLYYDRGLKMSQIAQKLGVNSLHRLPHGEAG